MASSGPGHDAEQASSGFLGVWRNTQHGSTSIPSVKFAPGDGGLALHVLVAEGGWVEAEAELFHEPWAAADPTKIRARLDLGPEEVLLHGWVKQGVLVLALFRRVDDGPGRSSHFDREFFYRAGVGSGVG